jgi:hypothetical protein
VPYTTKAYVHSIAETKELQEKSGLEISVTSIPYETKDETVEERGRVVYAGVSRMLTPDGAADVPFRVVERTTHGTVTVSPDRVGSIITINNKMNHVFRGPGSCGAVQRRWQNHVRRAAELQRTVEHDPLQPT